MSKSRIKGFEHFEEQIGTFCFSVTMNIHVFFLCGISLLSTTCFGMFGDYYYERYFPERCSGFWIHKNMTCLRAVLQQKLYGQHLVLKAVVNHIHGHLRKEEPLRSLALSFHGYTGTGKNYVSQMIAEHLYKMGMKSQFVHRISVTREFTHENKIDEYKDWLKSWIEGNVTICPQSLFIFDEVDKMPAGLLDTLKPYLDFYDNIAGVIYRKVIFIFLSNSGGNDIIKFALKQWKSGLPRENIQFADLEKLITIAAVNNDGRAGLWHSELLTSHLMTSLIPFLPLERCHVRKCIRHSFVSNQYYDKVEDIPDDVVREVMDEIIFYPNKEQVFATSGCKRVEQMVHFVTEMN